jgi:transketolase C-terminal domain/subunit
MSCIGLSDIYAKSGKPDELLRQYGLSAEKIEEAVKTVTQKKMKN